MGIAKHGKVRETMRHFPCFGAVACARLQVVAGCSAVIGIFLRESMCYLTPKTGDSIPYCLHIRRWFSACLSSYSLVCREDHEFSRLSSSQTWTEDREEGQDCKLSMTFFTYLSSQYLFYIVLTGLGICSGHYQEAKREGQTEIRVRHTGTTTCYSKQLQGMLIPESLWLFGEDGVCVSYLLTQLKLIVST